MRTRTRLGFAFTVGSNVFLFFGWVIPFWLGRFYGNYSKTQWSLFYRIQCVRGQCETIGGILSKAIVNFEGAEPRVELEAIAILATLGMLLDQLSLFIVLFFHCSVRGKSFSYFNYIFGAAVVQFVSALFVFFTIVVGGIAAGDFLSVRKMDSVIEFPWSILFYSIGLILMVVSAIIFILIVINWKRFRHIYARRRYYFDRSNIQPSLIEIKPEDDSGWSNRRNKYRNLGRPYGSESNLLALENPGYNGSLRYKYDPGREKYVGFLTELRNDKQYASLPTRGIRKQDFTSDTHGSSPYLARERSPSWHAKIDDVIKESHRLRLSSANFRFGDTYM